MARPLSEEKRNAILASATRAVAAQGLGAPTSAIARGAGVAEGTVFTYFPTKDALLNELYLSLKAEVAGALREGFPAEADERSQCRHVWNRFITWGVERPDAHRAMTQLAVSGLISQEVKDQGAAALADMGELIMGVTAPDLRDQPAFVADLMTALMEATISTIVDRPKQREPLTRLGFDACWRAISGEAGQPH